MKILVIDDDAGLRKSANLILSDEGYEVVQASDGESGLATAKTVQPDLILCDVRMPGMDGLEFLERYAEEGGDGLVIVMTAYGSLDLGVEAMKRGAYDYIHKPFGADEILLTIRKAEEREQLRREVVRLRREVRTEAQFGDIVARAPAMVEVLQLATKVAPHDSAVLITGETGTGKELVARLIHRESDRAERSFVAVNCGAIPDNLLESEFFGHLKGAFTGADSDKEGLFEVAEGGTLFLDEVGELPQALQVKLLRVLQEGEVRRVGGTTTKPVDVRVISATNRDLEASARDGSFRRDLYYRLAVVPIHLPALARRTEEIPELVRHFMAKLGAKMGIEQDGLEPEAMEILLDYTWPGNIRELENTLERAMVIADGPRIGADDLPEHVRIPEPPDIGMELSGDDLSVKRRTAALEKHLIRKALERTGGNKTAAAELLDLSARALRYKVQDYGLEDVT